MRLPEIRVCSYRCAGNTGMFETLSSLWRIVPLVPTGAIRSSSANVTFALCHGPSDECAFSTDCQLLCFPISSDALNSQGFVTSTFSVVAFWRLIPTCKSIRSCMTHFLGYPKLAIQETSIINLQNQTETAHLFTDKSIKCTFGLQFISSGALA